MRTQAELDDRAARVGAGRGAGRDLAHGRDIVAELIAERRAAARAENAEVDESFVAIDKGSIGRPVSAAE